MKIRVLHVGLGPIGASVVRQVASRPGLQVVGAVDIDPNKVGRELADVVDLDRKLRVKVTTDIGRTVRAVRPDVAVLCTSSSLKAIMPQLEELLKRKLPIVSTTEELSYPAGANRRLAKRVDEWARKAKVAVIGTGVNPGFVMDALPIALTAVCERVDSVEIHRVQDARVRRLPFQQKIGAGLTKEQFQHQVEQGTVRHVGMAESVQMLADALGWKLDGVTDEIEPKMADHLVQSDLPAVDPGYVCGIIQDGVGYVGGVPKIRLHMEAYLGAVDPYDSIRIEGSPRIFSKIDGGVHGDVATASIVVNSIPKIVAAPPGLHTMRSLPIPSFFGG